MKIRSSDMNKYIFYFLLVLLVACVISEQDEFNAKKWKLGDKLFYTVEIYNLDKDGESVKNAVKSTYKAELNVIKLGDFNELSWTIIYPERVPDSLLSDLQKKMNDTLREQEMVKLLYKTDEKGSYKEIVNLSEAKNYIDRQFEKQLMKYQGKKMSSDPIVQNMLALYTSDYVVETGMSLDLQTLHAIYGVIFGQNKKRYDDAFFGNKALFISAKMTTEIIRNQDNISIVQITSEPDSAGINNEVTGMLKEMMQKHINIKAKLCDTIQVAFNRETGWPVEVSSTRTITAGERKKKIYRLLRQTTY